MSRHRGSWGVATNFGNVKGEPALGPDEMSDEYGTGDEDRGSSAHPNRGSTGDGNRGSSADDDAAGTESEPARGEGAPDLSELADELAELRSELDAVEDRTVEKPALEAELKRYVRARMRRGRARGWGPYLVLLYGTIMTVAAFRFLDGWFAIGAMLILFLSTLGLYTLFVLVGVGLNLLSVPSRAADAIRRRR
ncbi:hypothetical protein RYH80_09165 [Halobaculum sp. MBLA0147]|uniref:hypothetical protein n=1 Tax=Halobaculum sp. MBLA0147 TaxID=3079934 RepID=UPI003524C37F